MNRIEQMDKVLKGNVLPKGESANAFRAYEYCFDRNLDCPDLDDIVWDNEVESTVNTFKKYGIKEFTFSCTASGAIETAMLFVKAGCTLEGIRDIFYRNDFQYNKETGKYGYVATYRPALVFRIKE